MLTKAAVNALFVKCLFADEELNEGKPPQDALIVQGITTDFGFHAGRVTESVPEIRALLAGLPDVFREGYSFLAMCNDRHGTLWGQHQDMQELVCLGVASGLLKECGPISMRELLPGGMPYYQITG